MPRIGCSVHLWPQYANKSRGAQPTLLPFDDTSSRITYWLHGLLACRLTYNARYSIITMAHLPLPTNTKRSDKSIG